MFSLDVANKTLNIPNHFEQVELQDNHEYGYLYFSMPLLLNAHRIVETGLCYGHATCTFLESFGMMSNPETRELHTYEINRKDWEKTERRIVDELHLANHLGKPSFTVHYEDSTKTVWSSGPIDILYLDSDHAYATVKAELENFTPSMADRSIIFTHDSWPGGDSKAHPSETFLALRDWAEAHGWRNVLFTYPEGITLLFRG